MIKEFKKIYVVYDARYWTDEDRATVILATHNKREAFKTVQDEWNGSAIVQYQETENGLENAKIINQPKLERR